MAVGRRAHVQIALFVPPFLCFLRPFFPRNRISRLPAPRGALVALPGEGEGERIRLWINLRISMCLCVCVWFSRCINLKLIFFLFFFHLLLDLDYINIFFDQSFAIGNSSLRYFLNIGIHFFDNYWLLYRDWNIRIIYACKEIFFIIVSFLIFSHFILFFQFFLSLSLF